MFKLLCKECDAKLTMSNINRLLDLDFTKLGVYCNNCFPEAEFKIKKQRLVEEYKGNEIYCKDNRFSPYWHSQYFFNKLEDARLRIDNKHLAVVDTEMLKFMKSI